MVICAAYGCKSRSEKKYPGITFHRFPLKNEERLKQWIANCHREDWAPDKNDRLCSLHFEPQSFRKTGEKVFLLNQAVPTIFPSLPSYLQLKTPMKRSVTTRETASCSALFSGASTSGVHAEDVDAEDSPRKKKLRKQLKIATDKCSSQRKKIKGLRQSLKRCKKQIVSLKGLLKMLQTRNLLSAESNQLLSNLTDFNKSLLKRTRGGRQKYSPDLRKFALTLNFLSPKAYDFVRTQFNTCLPHASTIGKWYQTISAEPGFTTESLRCLKACATKSDHKLLCSLVIDEIAIRQQVEWDGRRYFGHVNFGLVLEDDSNDVAKESFCLMLVCINGKWKIPIGYFLTNSLTGQQKNIIVKQAINLIQDCGVKVVSLTFDGAPSNITMSRYLGCHFEMQNLKTQFSVSNADIQLFLDPCHVIKLIRNTLGEKRIIIDGEGCSIKWEFIERLQELQNSEGFHLGNKARKAHVNFFKQKMKVRLAVQVLSTSVADALEYCEQQLHLPHFQGCAATAKFIRIMNHAFDILNSRTLKATGFKQALCSSNIENTAQYVNFVVEYISYLKFPNAQLVLQSARKTGFIGLIVSLRSALSLYDTYITINKSLLYLPTYKISQDHIELFFSSIRSRGGWNNNPTARQFIAAYKRLLLRAELRDGGIGNCVPLDQIPLLSVSSQKGPEFEINATAGNSIDNQTDDIAPITTHLEKLFEEHTYIMNTIVLSECSSQVIIYIAGFIVKYLQNVLKCEECLMSLVGEKENFLSSLITKKSRGGLTYPSSDVISVCNRTEKFIRFAQREGTLMKNVFPVIVNKVVHSFIDSNLFKTISEQDEIMQTAHWYLLLKSICSKYYNIRLHYIVKRQSEQVNPLRSHLTKIILFNGQ